MPAFQAEVPHTLGQDAAVARLKNFLDRVAERYKDQVSKMEGEWNENVLTFELTTFGFTISGTLTVEESSAKIDGKLPFAAVAFRGKIQTSIADELKRELDRAE